MGITSNQKQSALYPSLQAFQSSIKQRDMSPALTNLWSIHFTSPPMLYPGGAVVGSNLQAETGDLSFLLDYYAENVNLPSKQITTGTVLNIGNAYRYATGSSFSQFQMTFRMPASQKTRMFFERWASLMANDANNLTEFYETYCAPRVLIYKWERGGGGFAITDQASISALQGQGVNIFQKYRITGCWVLQNVFPFNIGSAQLDNSNAKVMTLPVSFYYERYRFYGEQLFDETRDADTITLPNNIDNFTGGDTSRTNTSTVNNWLGDFFGNIFNTIFA